MLIDLIQDEEKKVTITEPKMLQCRDTAVRIRFSNSEDGKIIINAGSVFRVDKDVYVTADMNAKLVVV